MSDACPWAKHLYIELTDSPDKIYSCGDVVRGNVVLHSDTEDTVAQISIIFRGVVETAIFKLGNNDQDQIVKSKNVLFEFIEVHPPRNYPLEANTHKWAFEFKFPNRTLPRLRKDQYGQSKNFHGLPGHPLPPDFAIKGIHPASISYHIEVIVPKALGPFVFHTSYLKYNMPLRFTPMPDTEIFYPSSIVIAYWLSRSLSNLDPLDISRQDSLGFTSRMTLSMISQPRSCFKLRTKLPHIVRVGGDFPIFVDIKHNLEKSTASATSTVFLTQVKVSLRARTDVRVPLQCTQIAYETIRVTDSGPIHVPVQNCVDLRNFVKDLSINHEIRPTFKIYNSARRYMLKVELTVVCGQNTSKLDLGRGRWQEIIILPNIDRNLSLPNAGINK